MSTRSQKAIRIWLLTWLIPLVICFASYGHSSPAQDVSISAVFGMVAVVIFLVPLFIFFLVRLVRAVDRTVGIATVTPTPEEIQRLALARIGRRLTVEELALMYQWFAAQKSDARTQLALLGGLYFVVHEHGG
jgi:hypothetical protein